MAKDVQKQGHMSTPRALTIALGIFAVGMLLWYVIPGLLIGPEAHREPETSFRSEQEEVHRRFNPATHRQLTLPDAVLVPTGEPVTLDKNKLAPVEVSREGVVLWSTTERPGGGGGTATMPDEKAEQVPAIGSALGPVYAELPDGRFLQLKQVQGGQDYENRDPVRQAP